MRVKRRFAGKLSLNASLLDAFVIGSNAREQLYKIIRHTNITPRDISKIATKMELVELNGNTNQVLNNHGANKPNQLVGSHMSKQPIINHGDVQVNQGNHTAPQYIGGNYVGNNQHSNTQWQQTKHRELPVDVPDSFIGVAKQSPRYPPPKPHRQLSPSTPNSRSFDNHQSSGNTAHGQMMHYNQTVHMQSHNLPPAHINNTINNSSLRDSKKLKQLEQQNENNQSQHHGIQSSYLQPAINQAFEPDEDESTTQNNANRQATTTSNQAQAPVAPLPDLCSVYSRLQRNLNSEFSDVANDANLSKLLSIYTTVIQQQKKRFELPELLKPNNGGPSGTNQTFTKATDLLHSVISILQEGDMSQDAVELLAILTKYEIQGVCSAFERIAQSFDFATKPTSPPTRPIQNATDNMSNVHQQHNIVHTNHTNQYIAQSPLVPLNPDMDNSTYPLHHSADFDMGDGVRFAKVEKTSCQPLGATVRNELDGSVVIGRVVSGGAAAESGLLHEGDEILEVNGIEMRGKNVNEVFDILNEMKGTLTFMIRVRNYPRPIEPMSKQRIFVKALFEYKAHEDEYIPCKDLGMSFDKGEILQIIDRSDPDWWQAYREADSQNSLAGLIPSQSFHIRKERVLSDSTNSTDAYRKYNRTDKRSPASILLNCGKGSSPRRRKKSLNIPMTPEEIPTYEEVCCYYPKGNMKRPIVMIGPTNIGRQEIRHRLLQEQDRFAAAIPHTTRPIKDREKNGLDYFYVSRAHFEADVKAGKFVEHGEYEKHYYGTSFEAIDAVVQSGKVSFRRKKNNQLCREF